MRRLAILLLAALAALSVGAASASANSYGVGYAGQRDATGNAVVAAAATWGSAWLAAHGKTECATKTGGRLMMASDLGLADGVNPAGGRALECDVWLKTSVVAQGNTKTFYGFIGLCEVETHELAHTAGMSHEEMTASGLEKLWMADCRSDFARKAVLFVRVQRKQAAERRRYGGG